MFKYPQLPIFLLIAIPLLVLGSPKQITPLDPLFSVPVDNGESQDVLQPSDPLMDNEEINPIENDVQIYDKTLVDDSANKLLELEHISIKLAKKYLLKAKIAIQLAASFKESSDNKRLKTYYPPVLEVMSTSQYGPQNGWINIRDQEKENFKTPHHNSLIFKKNALNTLFQKRENKENVKNDDAESGQSNENLTSQFKVKAEEIMDNDREMKNVDDVYVDFKNEVRNNIPREKSEYLAFLKGMEKKLDIYDLKLIDKILEKKQLKNNFNEKDTENDDNQDKETEYNEIGVENTAFKTDSTEDSKEDKNTESKNGESEKAEEQNDHYMNNQSKERQKNIQSLLDHLWKKANIKNRTIQKAAESRKLRHRRAGKRSRMHKMMNIANNWEELINKRQQEMQELLKIREQLQQDKQLKEVDTLAPQSKELSLSEIVRMEPINREEYSGASILLNDY